VQLPWKTQTNSRAFLTHSHTLTGGLQAESNATAEQQEHQNVMMSVGSRWHASHKPTRTSLYFLTYSDSRLKMHRADPTPSTVPRHASAQTLRTPKAGQALPWLQGLHLEDPWAATECVIAPLLQPPPPHFLNTTMLAVILSQPMPRASLGFLARQASSSSWQMAPAAMPRSSLVFTNSTACDDAVPHSQRMLKRTLHAASANSSM
jgi:hypothetical protein